MTRDDKKQPVPPAPENLEELEDLEDEEEMKRAGLMNPGNPCGKEEDWLGKVK